MFGNLFGRLRSRGDSTTILRGSLFVVVIQGASLVLNYGQHVLLARWLGQYEYGIFAYSWSWLNFLATLAAFGLPVLTMKHVAAFIETGDFSRARGALIYAPVVVALTTALVAGGGLLFLNTSSAVSTYYVLPLQLTLLTIVPYGLLVLFECVGRALGFVGLAYIPRQVLAPCGVIAIGFYVMQRGDPHATEVLAALIAVFFLVVACQGIALWFRTPREVRTAEPTIEYSAWTIVAASLFTLSALRLVQAQSDTLIIGALLSPDDVAVFSGAKRTSLLVASFLAAINSLAAPRIAALHAAGENARLQSVFRQLAPFAFLPALAAAGGILLFGDQVLSLFGKGFAAGAPLLSVFILSQLVHAGCGPCLFLLTMTGHQMVAVKIMLLTVVLQIALLAVLTPYWGIMGAATATAAGRIFWHFVVWGAGKRLTGLDSSILSVIRRTPHNSEQPSAE